MRARRGRRQPATAHGSTDGDGATPAEGLTLDDARGRWVLAVAVLGSSMAFLDTTVVNVALPDMGRSLGATTGQLQWVLSGYLLTLASFILVGGAAGDRFGRRRVFVVGVAVFTTASLLCALAPGTPTLVAARLIQGVGASLLVPGSLAMIQASFRPDQRARAIGAWSGLSGVASAIGPLLGGELVTAVSWRAVFLLNVPIGAFVAVAARRHVPETVGPDGGGPLDLRGAALAALGLAGVTYALVTGPGQATAAAIGLAGLAALAAFVVAEHRAEAPMLPLDMFRSTQFSAANVVTFVVYLALGGVFFLLVAFLQISLGYSPVAAGAASLPVTVLMLALSSRSGALAQRIGPRIPLTVGPLVLAAGLVMMSRLGQDASYLTDVLPAVVVFGLGLTLVVAPITATVLAAADTSRAGIASGVNNAVARAAGLLAVAVLPAVGGLGGERFYSPTAMATGFQRAMVVCAALAAAGGVLAWLTIRADALAPDQRPADVPTPWSCGVGAPPTRT